MKSVCSIVTNEEKTYLAFANIKGKNPVLFKEKELSLGCSDGDIISFLRVNSDYLKKNIIEAEKKNSFHVETVYLQLPWDMVCAKSVEDIIPFKKSKKIRISDIREAKKLLEDKYLNWDDHCLHNIVNFYKLNDQFYQKAPLGVLARKIVLNSVLIWIKDKIYWEAEEIFDSMDKNFGGFIAPQICSYFSVFSKRQESTVVINLDYSRSYFVASSEKGFYFGREFSFSIKKIVDELAKRFMIDFSLASEVFSRYITFKEIPYFKEITIKKKDSYLSVSIQSLNSFVRDFIKGNISDITNQIKEELNYSDMKVSFLGKLSTKEGFNSFLKDFLPVSLSNSTTLPQAGSSSFGCLKYGVNRTLDNIYGFDASLLEKVFKTYKEYF